MHKVIKILSNIFIIRLLFVVSDTADLPCDIQDGPTISPPNKLLVMEGESNTLSCTASRLQDSVIENVFFDGSSSDASEERVDIIQDSIIRRILSRVDHSCTTEICTYMLNISWTSDNAIREKLCSVRCVFIYQRASTVCRTPSINITFTASKSRDAPAKINGIKNIYTHLLSLIEVQIHCSCLLFMDYFSDMHVHCTFIH